MMATIQELEAALVKADRAGDTDSARKLAAVLLRARQDPVTQIPDIQVEETVIREPEPTIGELALGAGETGLTLATGATSGAVGMLGGTLKGMAEQLLSGKFGSAEAANLVEKSAMEGAQALTYQPRSAAGQEMVAETGEAIQQFLPAIPVGAELAAATASARAAKPLISAAAEKVAAPVRNAATKVTEIIRQPNGAPNDPPDLSSLSAQREAAAQSLPVPIELTKGQKTRQFEDVRFERETAKLTESGAPLRERFDTQNQQLRQNLDSFIDQTGATAVGNDFRRIIGVSVDEALRSRAARDKNRIRVLYKEAEKAGELSAPVNMAPLAEYLNQNRAGRSSAPILKTISSELEVQGVGSGSLANGTLQVGDITLGQAESLRKSINKFANKSDPNDLRVASELKQVIDNQTEGLGGNLYKKARAARAKYAEDYENIGLVGNLLGTKRGSADRAIALEDVLKRSITDPTSSLDSVRQLRRLLHTEGPKGMQAWKELQGGTLQYIKEQALRNVAPDQLGNRAMSPAQLDRVITSLDKSGKLDFVFGKKGAGQLRTVNDVAKIVLTTPAGAVNTSNTASVLAGLLDVAISGTSGVPAPVMTSFRLLTKNIKDKRIKARVKRALEG